MQSPPKPQRRALALAVPLSALLAPLSAQASGPINATLLAPPAAGEAEQLRAAEPIAAAVAACRDAVVHPYVWYDRRVDPYELIRPSSGVVVDPSGLVLTLWDLVREAVGEDGAPAAGVLLKVKLRSGRECPATLLAKDVASGLALLKIDAGDEKLTVCPVGRARHRVEGAPNALLSFHDGKDQFVYGGVLLRPAGKAAVPDRTFTQDACFLTDAAVRRTAHGAAVLGAGGVLLGICDASGLAPEVTDPSLEQMQRPNFGVAIPVEVALGVFATHLRGAVPAKGATLDQASQAPAARVLAQVRGSIVGVFGGDGAPPEEPDETDPYATRRRVRLGSGVIVDPSGLVLTNQHLVGGRQEVAVIRRDRSGRRHVYRAAVVGSDNDLNIALLKLKGTGALPAVELGSSAGLMRGETVVAVGNPYGAALAASVGVVSAVRSAARIQADPNLGNQNGGGAVLDLSGRLVGIVDQGRVDPLVAAFARSKAKKEVVKLETNLAEFAGIDGIRQALRTELIQHGGEKLTAAPGESPAHRRTRTTAVVRTVERVGKALLNVYVNISSKQADLEDNPFAAHKPMVITRGLGSGFVITSDGLAMTNWHVVDEAVTPRGVPRQDHTVHVTVLGKRYDVEVLSISREDDLALLQLKLGPGEKLVPLEFGDSKSLQIGETVIAVGNPHGRPDTVTVGVVTAKDQSIRVRNRFAWMEDLIKTDAAINPGNSGGALLDVAGRLVGVNSAGAGGRNVTGYAISVNYVRSKLNDQLLGYRKLRTIFPGFVPGDADGQPIVTQLNRFGPAARDGLKNGDRLLALDGEPLRWSVGLIQRIRTRDASRPLVFRIRRDGAEREVKVQPWSNPVWSVVEQIGCETETVKFRDAPDLIKAAAIAVHRGFTRNPAAEPSRIEASAVRVRKVMPGDSNHPLRDGDLLLSCQVVVRGPAGDTRRLVPFTTVAEVRDFFNQGRDYEKREYDVWVYRGDRAELLTVTAQRLRL